MKGITPIVIAAIALILALIFLNNMPASILDDCGQAFQAGGRAQYAPRIIFDGSMPGSDYAGQYKYALLVQNVPQDAVATKTEVLVSNSMSSAVLIASEGSKCSNGDRIYLLSISIPMQQYFTLIEKRNPEGTYSMRYTIEYSIPLPTPIPVSTPVPTTEDRHRDPSGRIFILSDIIDGVGSIIGGIIAFISIPFLPPAP